jgi:N-acetylneuraminic acid mutarotase
MLAGLMTLGIACSTDETEPEDLPTAPLRMEGISGDHQVGVPLQLLGEPLLIRVLRDTKPLAGVQVSWAVIGGGGSVSEDLILTDAQGRAQIHWTLGASPGENRVRASIAPETEVLFRAAVQPACAEACGQWIEGAPLTSKREGLASAVIGDLIYLVGGDHGFDWCEPGTPILDVYDPSTNSWTGRAPMPTPRNGLMAAQVHGQLFALGGCGAGTISANSVPGLSINERYDPETDQWADAAPLPYGVAGGSAVVLDGKILVVGGGPFWPNSPSSAVSVYDPVVNSWAQGDPMPEPRIQHAAVVVGGQLYVLGGQPDRRDLIRFDPATREWTELASMARLNGPVSAVELNGQIFATASYGNTEVVEVYDPATNVWSRRADLPGGRIDAAIVTWKGRVYIFGGNDDTKHWQPQSATSIFVP